MCFYVIICNQKRHYSQPLKKMLKDTFAKTLLQVFGVDKHTPQTLSFTFRTCIFNNHKGHSPYRWADYYKKASILTSTDRSDTDITRIINISRNKFILGLNFSHAY